jgi:hypothetical protein
LPGRLARQTCPADLPWRLARETCPADLPGRLAMQTCPADLSTLGQTWSYMTVLTIHSDLPGCTSRLVVNLKQTCPADLPGRLSMQTCPADLSTLGQTWSYMTVLMIHSDLPGCTSRLVVNLKQRNQRRVFAKIFHPKMLPKLSLK